MNKAFLVGNLTRDPELKKTSGDISFCNFTVAVNRRFANANGERETDFIPVVVWRAQADNCAKYLSKGSPVAVVGEIRTRSYTTQNGEKRYITEIQADDVQFLPRNNQGGRSSAGDAPPPPPPPVPAREVFGDETSDFVPMDDSELPF